MGLFDFVKSVGNKIMDTVGSGYNRVMDVAKGARDAVNSAYNTISKIPVICQAIDALTNAPIPMAGNKSLNDLAKGVSNAIDTVDGLKNNISGIKDSINRGDVQGIYNQGVDAFGRLKNIPRNF